MTGEAERYLRRLAESELRQAGGTARVEAAADVLVGLGAVGEADAQTVLNQLATALAVRDRQQWRSLYGIFHPRWRERGPVPGGPGRPVRPGPCPGSPGFRPGSRARLRPR